MRHFTQVHYGKLKNTLLYITNIKRSKSTVLCTCCRHPSIEQRGYKSNKKRLGIDKTKVLEGKAHLISGGDTEFLEASTTGSKNQKLLTQPNNAKKQNYEDLL